MHNPWDIHLSFLCSANTAQTDYKYVPISQLTWLVSHPLTTNPSGLAIKGHQTAIQASWPRHTHITVLHGGQFKNCANMFTRFGVLFWLGTGRFYPYPSVMLHWHWGNHMIALVPVNQLWRIWVNHSHQHKGLVQPLEIKVTNLCVYFSGYTILYIWAIMWYYIQHCSCKGVYIILELNWNLFSGVQFAMFQHWFR